MDKKRLRAAVSAVAPLFAAVCLLAVLLGAFPGRAQAIAVRLDSKPVTFDTPPRIVDGRTLVPVRAIFEALGFRMDWNAAQQQVIGTRGSLTIVMRIGDRVVLKNNDKITLDVPPQIIGGRTLVPLRFIAEAVNTYVSWDGEHQTVRISTRADSPPTGKPIAQGDYDPSQPLVLTAQINQKVDVEVDLEAGALTQAAAVRLYSDNANSYRLVVAADPVTANLPGVQGFSGARVKFKLIEKAVFPVERPLLMANGEMIYNKCFIGKDAITAGIKIVERDTTIVVGEASDAQWGQVELSY